MPLLCSHFPLQISHPSHMENSRHKLQVHLGWDEDLHGLGGGRQCRECSYINSHENLSKPWCSRIETPEPALECRNHGECGGRQNPPLPVADESRIHRNLAPSARCDLQSTRCNCVTAKRVPPRPVWAGWPGDLHIGSLSSSSPKQADIHVDPRGMAGSPIERSLGASSWRFLSHNGSTGPLRVAVRR